MRAATATGTSIAGAVDIPPQGHGRTQHFAQEDRLAQRGRRRKSPAQQLACGGGHASSPAIELRMLVSACTFCMR